MARYPGKEEHGFILINTYERIIRVCVCMCVCGGFRLPQLLSSCYFGCENCAEKTFYSSRYIHKSFVSPLVHLSIQSTCTYIVHMDTPYK